MGSKLDIRIKEQNELIPFLKDRRSDIAIILEQSLDSSLLVKKLFDYELILVSNRKIAENIKLEQLLGFRFIKDRTHRYLDDVLQKHGVDEGRLDVAYSLDGSIMVCRVSGVRRGWAGGPSPGAEPTLYSFTGRPSQATGSMTSRPPR